MTPAKLPHDKEIPTVQLGKNGLTEAFFNELREQLKVYKIIRVRILKNAPFEDRDNALSELEQNLPHPLRIIEKKGWTAIIK